MLQFRLIPFFLPHPLFLNKEPIALSCGHLSFTEIAECTARIRAMLRASQVACIFLHYPHNKQTSKLSWNCHYTHTHTHRHAPKHGRTRVCLHVYIYILIQTQESTSALHLFFLVHFYNSFKLWFLCYINKERFLDNILP